MTGFTASTDFPTSNPLQPTNDGGVDAFVAAFDPTGQTLLYSTYLGGSGDDYGQGIAVDSVGDAYVTGYTGSTNFPTSNPLQPTNHGGADAFVAALDPAGATLLYSTYLGGSAGDVGYGYRCGQRRQRLRDWVYRLDQLPHVQSLPADEPRQQRLASVSVAGAPWSARRRKVLA